MTINWLWVFLLIFLSDVAWVLCVRRTQAGQALMAGLWAVGIFLPTALVTVGYVKDPWLLIPAALGHLLGTYATVKWDSKKHES